MPADSVVPAGGAWAVGLVEAKTAGQAWGRGELVQMRAVEPVGWVRSPAHRTYRRSSCPVPVGRHSWSRPTLRLAVGRRLVLGVTEPGWWAGVVVSTPPEQGPPRSYRRTLRPVSQARRRPDRSSRGRWAVPGQQPAVLRLRVFLPALLHSCHKRQPRRAVVNHSLGIQA